MSGLNKFLLLVCFISCVPKGKLKTIDIVEGVTAHRGNSIAFPENTLKAFQSGIDVGADWVELDIHKSKDGQIVVSHDKNTRRASGVDMLIASTDYVDLLKVDVATEFREKNKLTLKECPPEQMPLLTDAIKVIMKQTKTKLSIQPKMDCVADAIAIVRQLNAEKMVGFNDASLPLMSKVKTLAPNIRVFWDGPANADIAADIKIAKQWGFENMVMHFSSITPEKVNMIKSAGIRTGAWTVNDPKVMNDLLNIGVERIYTDDPKTLIEIKKKANR